MTLRYRVWSKKTEGRTARKSKGGTLAAGIYLQRGSTPSPSRRVITDSPYSGDFPQDRMDPVGRSPVSSLPVGVHPLWVSSLWTCTPNRLAVDWQRWSPSL